MIEFKIPNLKKFQKALKDHPQLFIKEFQQSISKSGFIIESESKKVTPVDTGRLRSSIRTDLGFLRAVVSPNTDYAIYVHEGTKRMIGRPYMKWGLDKSENRIINIFKETENKILREIAKKANV